MRIPKNKIQTGKYTSGGEFYTKSTQIPYQGYYYIFNNLFFAGKEYDPKALEIIKLEQTNSLLFRASTFIFSKISGLTSQSLKSPKITSLQPNLENKLTETRYFCKQINIYPIIIKETDEKTYNALQGNPLYQTTFLNKNQNLEQADKQMPGLKTFLTG